MASKLNVKFMVILGSVLAVLAAGVATTAYFVLTKSAAEHVALGDKAIAQGDFKTAVKEYSKAVNEEQGNLEYLQKWRVALESYVPEDRGEFDKLFQDYAGLNRMQALAARNDIGLYDSYFAFLRRTAGPNIMIDEVTNATRAFASASDASWKRLLKYRAIARTDLLAGGRELTPEEMDATRTDFEAARIADPDDEEVAFGLHRFHAILSSRALSKQDSDAAAEQASLAAQALGDFRANHPDDPRAALYEFSARVNPELARARGDDLESARTSVSVDDLDRVAAALSQVADRVTVEDVQRLQIVELVVTQSLRAERTNTILDRMMTDRADDVTVLRAKAILLRVGGRHQDAIEMCQRILDLPPPRVSIEGKMLPDIQTQALVWQSESAFSLWERATQFKDQAGIAQAEAVMRRAHDEVESRLPGDSPLLLLTRARLAYVQGEKSEARRLLLQYAERASEAEPQVLWMLALTSAEVGNWTETQQRLELLLAVSPNDARAIELLARTYVQLRQPERAVPLLEALVTAIPDSTDLRNSLDQARIEAGMATSEDPISAALRRAINLAQGSATTPPDVAGGIESLNASIASLGQNPRLMCQLTRLLLFSDQIDRAREVMDIAILASPDDEEVKRLHTATQGETTLQVLELLVRESEGAEVSKLCAISQMRRSRGMTEAADEALDQAAQLSPDDPQVIDLLFRRAVERNDAADADRIASIGERLNLDGAGGRSFRAQVRELNGDAAGSLRLLREATDLRPDNVGLLQMLGQRQFASGLIAEALATYQRAMDKRGYDPRLIADYVQRLDQAGRPEQALLVLREQERFTQGDRVLQDLRLDLEGRVGDRTVALDTRRAIAQKDPKNKGNRFKLAALLIDVAEWGEAKGLIDQLRADGDDLSLATLAAKWHAEQRDVEGAKGEFTRYIQSCFEQRLEDETGRAYRALGRFLIQYGDPDGGISAIESAKRWENPKTLEVEKLLADNLMRLGRLERAVASYRTIVDAGADTASEAYRLRLVEALLNLERFDEAETELAKLSPSTATGETVVLLRAEIATRRGDDARARTILSEAVRAFPNSTQPYFRRSLLAIRAAERSPNERLVRDALDDLNAANAVDPTDSDVLRRRSYVKFLLGDIDGALADLRETVRSRPPTPEFLVEVMSEFLRRGRGSDAAGCAQDALNHNPTDSTVMLAAGTAFARFKDWPRARQYFQLAWDRTHGEQAGANLVGALLEGDNPRIREAGDVLTELAPKIEGNARLLLTRAEYFHLRGANDQAIRETTKAFALIAGQPSLLQGWFTRLQEILGDTPILVTAIEEASKDGRQLDLLRLFRARALSRVPGRLSSAMTEFDALLAPTISIGIRSAAMHAKAGALLDANRYDEAAAVWIKYAPDFPNDWQLHNNLAYVLTEHLDRAGDAVSYAQRAVALAGERPDVLDTLGWTQFRAGNLDKAVESLQKAQDLADSSSPSRPVIALHLAAVHAARGNGSEARRNMSVLVECEKIGFKLAESDMGLRQDTQSKIDSLP
ncbi:MAG: tetratricopeptide repeat protein [Phycisphaeraceae bacterium]|nr:tetratricopeptide repeat protein [Phycisphaeraceae bacterium]